MAESDLDTYFIPVEEQEEIISQPGRRAERYMQRGIESILGLPGDIVQTVRGLASMLPGGIQPTEKQSFIQRAGRSLLESLPGSAELRARSAEVRPQLEPQSQFESMEDEVVSDFATLALPTKGKIPFAKALGLSMAGNMGAETAKALGVGEKGQAATKMGLMLFGGMFGRGRGIRSHINNLYDKAREVIPEGAKFRYPSKALANVEVLMRKGSVNEAKAPVLKIIEDIKAKSPNGMISVEEAIQFDQDINRAIGRAWNDKALRGNLKQLKKAHSTAMDAYAKENPSFGDYWKEAKQAYQGIAQSVDIQNYIRRNTNLKNIAHAALLLGLEESAIPGRTAMKLGSVGATAATLYAAEVSKRLAKNPALRRYYQNVVSASLNENKAQLSRNLAGLERVAKNEFEKNPLPIFDITEMEEEE